MTVHKGIFGQCAECGEAISADGGVCYECGGLYYHECCLDDISRRRLFFEFDIDREKLLEAAGFREVPPPAADAV